MGWPLFRPRTNLEASGGQVLCRNVRLIQQLLDVPDNYGPGRDILKNQQDAQTRYSEENVFSNKINNTCFKIYFLEHWSENDKHDPCKVTLSPTSSILLFHSPKSLVLRAAAVFDLIFFLYSSSICHSVGM